MRIAAASMPLTIPDGDALRVYTKALQCQMEYEVMRLLHNAHVFVNVRRMRYLYDKCKFTAFFADRIVCVMRFLYVECVCNAFSLCRNVGLVCFVSTVRLCFSPTRHSTQARHYLGAV
jgi:hypothetical protein